MNGEEAGTGQTESTTASRRPRLLLQHLNCGNTVHATQQQPAQANEQQRHNESREQRCPQVGRRRAQIQQHRFKAGVCHGDGQQQPHNGTDARQRGVFNQVQAFHRPRRGTDGFQHSDFFEVIFNRREEGKAYRQGSHHNQEASNHDSQCCYQQSTQGIHEAEDGGIHHDAAVREVRVSVSVLECAAIRALGELEFNKVLRVIQMLINHREIIRVHHHAFGGHQGGVHLSITQKRGDHKILFHPLRKLHRHRVPELQRALFLVDHRHGYLTRAWLDPVVVLIQQEVKALWGGHKRWFQHRIGL